MFTRVKYATTPRNCRTRYPPRYSNGWAEFWLEPMKPLVNKLNHAHWLRIWYNGVVSLLPPFQYIPTLLTHPNHINIYTHPLTHTPPTKVNPHLHPQFSKISWNPCFGFKSYYQLQLIRLLDLIKFDIRNKCPRHNLINRWRGWVALIHTLLLHLRFSTRTTLVEYDSSFLCNNLCYSSLVAVT